MRKDRKEKWGTQVKIDKTEEIMWEEKMEGVCD